jgi:cytidyltransferase-like protein
MQRKEDWVTTYPKNVFLGSFDPMHYGHLDCWLRGEEQLNEPVALVMGYHRFKTPMFSMEKRREFIKLYRPAGLVYLALTEAEVSAYLEHANKVIIGLHPGEGLDYYRKMYSLMGCPQVEHHLLAISGPPKAVRSSTVLKDLVRVGNFTAAEGLAHPQVVRAVWEKLKAQDDPSGEWVNAGNDTGHRTLPILPPVNSEQ